MDGNALQIVFADGYKQRPGQAGPLLGNAAILMTRDGLMAIDPLTGRTLWVRQDVGLDTTILTDGLTLALVSMDATNGKPVGTRGVRAIDGSPVAVPDCSTALSRKLRVEGGNILWLDDAAEKRKLRYTEALSMRDIWSLDLSADALVIQTDDLPFAGTVEPDGTTKIFELATARELMVARLDPRHVKGSQPFLASDSERFYIGLNHTPDAQASIQANFLNSSGIKSRLIDGELYALSRSNGKLAWRATCQQQAILLDNLDLTPTVILASRSNRPMPNNPNFRQTQVSIRSYDKRTGKLLFEKETPSQQPFTSVNIDTRKGTIDLVSPQNTISHQVTAEPVPAGPVLRDEALPAQPNGGNSR
jgi:outer membrane protein assembly factor BamB